MGTNPLLMLQSIGGWVTRAAGALDDRFVVIAASVCDGWFNHEGFPAYEAIYEKLQSLDDPRDLIAFEEEFATRPEWVHAYRERYAYHPFHGFSMAYMGGIATRKALEVMIVGAKKPGYARGMGCRPVRDVDAAMQRAQALLQEEIRPIVVPFMSKPAVHLTSADEAAGARP
jgi:hypothetical protein